LIAALKRLAAVQLSPSDRARKGNEKANSDHNHPAAQTLYAAYAP
jgi:hypothetical protein